ERICEFANMRICETAIGRPANLANSHIRKFAYSQIRLRRTEVSMSRHRAILMGVAVAAACAATPVYAQLLVPMDNAQANHLKAYGLTYWVLDHHRPGEWLLNYRAGSFLLPDRAELRREPALR